MNKPQANEKVDAIEYLRQFWPPFVFKEQEEYEVEDIFIAFEALKSLGQQYAGYNRDIDKLFINKEYMNGVLTGILIAMDEIPRAAFISVEKTTKLRACMKFYFALLKDQIGVLLG